MTMDPVASSILAAIKRGASSGVSFSADVLVGVLATDYRWHPPQIADLLRCLRRAAQKASAPK